MSCSTTYGDPRSASGRGGWRPFELAAMIGGFVLFWPVGLAILAWKGWREGWWGPNARTEGQGLRMPWQGCGPRGWRRGGDDHAWSRELNRDSGNSAFEDYKSAELDRLQAEFERLAREQREFAEHIEQLRRAKDKAEFDSFLASRRSPPAGGKGPAPDESGSPAAGI
jgi:hypothetical protein